MNNHSFICQRSGLVKIVYFTILLLIYIYIRYIFHVIDNIMKVKF